MPAPELTSEQIKKYSRGLDEISYNLEESKDFFQAGIDGRLAVYHSVEQEIIQLQLEALHSTAPESIRTAMLMPELTQDLEYVQQNDDKSPEALARREKMLRNHRAYLKVPFDTYFVDFSSFSSANYYFSSFFSARCFNITPTSSRCSRICLRPPSASTTPSGLLSARLRLLWCPRLMNKTLFRVKISTRLQFYLVFIQ